ncbi:MAG: CPBP family intramembrane metalloprotease [Bacteroidales bacterium]|nr:CPBP family intramembrane metalloprotease [Bacteroidales bacterium]
MRRFLLVSELIVLFIGVPLLFYFDWIPGPKSIPLLLAFVYCLAVLLLDKNFDRKKLGANRFRGFRCIMVRFFFTAALLTVYLLIFEPQNLFVIPKEKPWLWVAIMVFYPLWSALPQELIFRVFYFHRYQQIIPNKKLLLFLNAFLFAFMHIIFNNWIALFGGFIVGIFWAQTYLRNQSLLTVSIEHAIYGNFIYTIGLGHYFYVPDF